MVIKGCYEVYNVENSEQGLEYELTFFPKGVRQQAVFDFQRDCYQVLEHPYIFGDNDILFETTETGNFILVRVNKSARLSDRIYNIKDLYGESEINKFICYKLAKALQFMHQNGVTHNNLRVENILEQDGKFKLFRMIPKELAENFGYKKPGEIPSEKLDIFSLGIVFFELIICAKPFQTPDASDWWYNKIISRKFSLFWKAFSKKEPSPEFKELIQKMFVNDPERRITLEQVLSDPWFKELVDDEQEIRNHLDE